MTYAHSLSRPTNFDPDLFALWSKDCQWIVAYSRTIGLKLAGPDGTGRPTVNEAEVLFNGREHCRHYRSHDSAPRVLQRTCRGRCAHDSFSIERDYDGFSSADRYGARCHDRVATALKPYDIAVTASLLMLAHRFGDAVRIASDGGPVRWVDGQQLALLACGVFPALPRTLFSSRAA